MGTVTGNVETGNITIVQTPGGGSVTVETDRTLDAADAGRFNQGTLTDSTNNVFTVVSHTSNANNNGNFTVTVNLLPGGVAPVAGQFSLQDDDVLTNGQPVGFPDTSTLASALADAYVETIFNDVGSSNNNVPFDLNVESSELRGLIQSQWESRVLNANDFWVVYLMGAFQGRKDMDGDADSETSLSGVTAGGPSGQAGGSLIYKEVNADYARRNGIPLSINATDTVVHEVGHALGKSGLEPVTRLGEALSRPSVYRADYLNLIRSADKPLS